MMIDANKKMAVVYMKENPVQHKGETGREINFEDSKLFTEPEIEKIFQAAGKIEVFFEDIFRNESFNEAAQELFEALGTHIGFDGLKIWTDRDIVLRDIEWSKAKKELLQRQEKKLDLLKVIKDSKGALNIIHDSILSKIVTDELKEQCEFLVNMGKRTVMINSDVWFVFRFTGNEENKDNISLGLGVDYYQLYWNRYRAVWEKMNKK